MRALLAVATVLLVAGSAAAKDAPRWFGQLQLQQPVEQQTPGWSLPCPAGYVGDCSQDRSLWVTNPTGCIWDVDDNGDLDWDGDLIASAQTSVTACVVEDWRVHPLSFGVNAHSDLLDATVCVGSDCHTLVPFRVNANTSGYEFCVVASSLGLPLPLVEGSNGGIGALTTFVFTVRNPTRKTARDVRASFRAGWSRLPQGCG